MALLASACGGGDDGLAPAATVKAEPKLTPTFAECNAGDQAFVRNSFLAVLGHRPMSQAEVNAYTDLMTEVRALGDDDIDPEETVVRALAAQSGYVDRWSDQLMDALRVARIEGQSQDSCYGVGYRSDDDGSLARYVRDNPSSASGDGNGRFTMEDLMRSALVLDDVSVVYRAHLYALVSRAIPAANVPRVQAELARREDFGLVFDSAFLNRDIVCLGCHNSEDSVTYSPDPTMNRHWSIPGLFEKAIYGDSFGIDTARAHAAFRYDGFVADIFSGDEGETRPWGWSANCGGFYPSGLPDDPADVDGKFGNLTGKRLTVYDLEDSLQKGFASIAANGLQRGANGEIADPNAAFAYMVSASIVESVWKEVIGTPLTIANYFPRNEVSRDMLQTLTEGFIASKYSLVGLLVQITKSGYFNRAAPEAGCGSSPYDAPAIYDPWVIGDMDPARRNNGSGDAVAALSGRTLYRASYAAMEWRPNRFATFPEVPAEVQLCSQFFTCPQMEARCMNQGSCCLAWDYICVNPPGPNEPTSGEERAFQRGVGVFLKNGERGFRGLDFQARLVWENRVGACSKPTSDPDFIDTVASLSQSRSGTVRDVVAAIKDRLIGDGSISEAERQVLEPIFGAGLDSAASSVSDLEGSMRALCGVLVSTPQFLLGGMAAPDGTEVPALTPDSASYDTTCNGLAASTIPKIRVRCSGGALTVERSGS